MKTIHITLIKLNNSPRRVMYYARRYLNDSFKMHNSTLRIIMLFLTLTFCCSTFLSGRVAVAESTTFTINNNNTVLELTVPSNISLELNPTTGTDFNTVNLPIGVGTNNQYGYILSMTIPDDTLTRTGSITDGDNNTSTPTINSITSSYSPASFEDSNDTLNAWGYKLSNNTNYLPIPTSTTTLKITASPSNSTNITTGVGDINLSFATKVDTTTPAGTYQTTINFTAVTNAVGPLLYDVIAGMNKGTQTALDLQQPITEPTSSNPATDTSNSGVYEYNSAVFGVASDASNDYPIYYYRGILDSAFASTDDYGNIGSSGNGGYYPNYVRLGNTCWRIVRTTGSGGVKMIYNGLYSSGMITNSCANALSDTQIAAKAFNAQSNINYKSIIAVGYTFDDNYKTMTENTDYGLLFGSNISYSNNSTNSTIKNYIENAWFTSVQGVSPYEGILESSAGYCNDRSAYNTSNILINDDGIISTPYTTASSGIVRYDFGAKQRNQNQTATQAPSLSCPRNNADLYTTTNATNGNNQLSKPIAILTADEASFSGSGAFTASQGSSYHSYSFLRSGSPYWLLSPNYRITSGIARVFNINQRGNLSYDGVNNSQGVRPVVSLIHSTTIFAGSGTATDPWIIAAP